MSPVSTDSADDYVVVEPQADGSFRIRYYRRTATGGYLAWPSREWRPTRRELKRLAREGRTAADEAARRGRHVLEVFRTGAAQEAALREQIARLT